MALVKIRMLDSGPNKNHYKGEVIEVDRLRADVFIAQEHAEEVKDGDSLRVDGRKDIPKRVRPVGKLK